MPGTEKADDAPVVPFSLKNADGGFEGRSSDIFGGLDILERKHISQEQSRTDLDDFADLTRDDDLDNDQHGRDPRDKSLDRNQEKNENIQSNVSDNKRDERESSGDTRRHQQDKFRRPSGRPPGRNPSRRNHVPNHGNKPQNWTYYSLEDVDRTDMSNKSNTQAALAFLDERRKLREHEEEMEAESFDVESAACSKGLFSFAKRNKTDDSSVKDKGERSDKSSNKDKSETSKSQTAAALSVTEAGGEGEGKDEGGTAESTSSSSKDDSAKPSFKNRKGIRRNIRVRDDDED